jgi:CBS domain-containing protein
LNPNQLMKAPVTQLLTEARAFSPGDSVAKVIGYLKESKLTDALAEDGADTYIVSVNDLLNITTIDTKVASVMHQVQRLGPNNTVGDAATLMREFRTRSLPVYQGKKLLGQITAPSMVGRLLDTDLPGKISSIMTPNPVCLEASEKVSKARETMIRKKFDQLPVLKSGALDGIITSESIVFNLAPKVDDNRKGNMVVGRYADDLGVYAKKDVVTNDVADPPREVYRNLSNAGSNYSVIVAGGEIQGIVTYRDFLTVLSRKALDTSVPMYIVGLPEDPFEAATARTKFLGAVELLRRATPDLEEARAVIKTGDIKSPKKKYQVRVFLVYPRRHYSYKVFSRELADAFDYVNGWMKEVATKSRPRRTRTSNARSYPDDWRPETAPG